MVTLPFGDDFLNTLNEATIASTAAAVAEETEEAAVATLRAVRAAVVTAAALEKPVSGEQHERATKLPSPLELILYVSGASPLILLVAAWNPH